MSARWLLILGAMVLTACVTSLHQRADTAPPRRPAHIASAHFRKYKAGTQAMVKSLVLHETDPILLGTKRSDVLTSYGVASTP